MAHDAHERLKHVPGYIPPTERPLTLEEREIWMALEKMPILQDIDEDTLTALARVSHSESYIPGSLVVKQGDAGPDRRFYVVVDGVADVIVDQDGEPTVIASLVDGDHFGEISLLTGAPRNATIRAAGNEPLRVLSFDAVTFLGVIAHHVLVFRIVRSQRRGGGNDPLQIREMGLFSEMPLHALSVVLHDAQQNHYPEGTDIVEQGKTGDRFHVILDGTVEVLRDGRQVAHLGAGEFFGETALLYNCPRTATVRAHGPCVTWSINKESFELVLRHYLLDNRRTRDTIATRLRAAG